MTGQDTPGHQEDTKNGAHRGDESVCQPLLRPDLRSPSAGCRWHTVAVPNPLPRVPDADAPLTAEELAALQGVGAVRSVDDVRADLWKDDAEVDAFLEDVRRARRANVA